MLAKVVSCAVVGLDGALVRFDPASEVFDVFPHATTPASVRQLLGRPAEVWGAESSADKLFVRRTR